MTFRLTRKLHAKIKAGTLASPPLDENPFADWSAGLFQVGRTQYILLTNTQSLYSIVFPGKGITNERTFIEVGLSSLLNYMEADGHMGAYERLIAPVSGSVLFAKALNRSVTGSMNDMIKHASFYLADGDCSLFTIATKLNGIPMSALMQDGSPYGFPRRVFSELVDTHKSSL